MQIESNKKNKVLSKKFDIENPVEAPECRRR